MKRLFTIVTLGAGLLAGSAIAQSPEAPPGSAPVPSRSVKITAEQGYVIKENVLKSTAAATSGQSGESRIEIGDKAPEGTALQDFPDFVVQKVPAVKSHKFFVSNGQVMIVDPKDHTVADILK